MAPITKRMQVGVRHGMGGESRYVGNWNHPVACSVKKHSADELTLGNYLDNSANEVSTI